MPRVVWIWWAFDRHHFQTWYAPREYHCITNMVKALALGRRELLQWEKQWLPKRKFRAQSSLCLCHLNADCQKKKKRKGELSFLSSPCYTTLILTLSVSEVASLLQHSAAISFREPHSQPWVQPLNCEKLSPSHSYSHSYKSFSFSPTTFPKSCWINWQKQLWPLAWLPNIPIDLSLLSSSLYSKCSQQNLLSCCYAIATWLINSSAPKLWSTLLAHNWL